MANGAGQDHRGIPGHDVPDRGKTYKSLLDPGNKLTEDECQAAFATVGLGHVVSAAGDFHLPLSKSSCSYGQRQLLSLTVIVARIGARQKRLVEKIGLGTEQRPLLLDSTS